VGPQSQYKDKTASGGEFPHPPHPNPLSAAKNNTPRITTIVELFVFIFFSLYFFYFILNLSVVRLADFVSSVI
jgi:hypothetical protein